MKDKIVYIGSNIPDQSPAGVRVFANALALKEYGFDVKIISKDDDLQTDYAIHEGIETWHLSRPRSAKALVKSIVDAESYTRIIDGMDNVKALIAYDQPSVVFMKLRIYCKQKSVKLICETTEWQKWSHLGHLGIIARIIRLLDININMHYAYKKADGLILTSNYFKKKLKSSLPTLVLPVLQYKRLNIPKTETVNSVRKFIYAGGIGYGKDMLCDIIQAFGKIQGKAFEFNILGLSEVQYMERFPEDADALKRINQGAGKIRFWGKVSHNEVLVELRKSDFSLIIRENSHRNNIGFPTKFGESINSGTPVIVTEFSDVVYYTRKYEVGIITDIYNIVEGINKALDLDDETLLKMHENCRKCLAFYYKEHIDEIGGFVTEILQKMI